MSRELIAEWHCREVNVAYPAQPARLVLGCPIWGEHYVNRFVDWCLPSIVTSRVALTVFGWEMIIYTDLASAPRITEALIKYRVPGQVREVPPDVMKVMELGGQSKYWLLAAVHNALICEAGRRGAGFHMLVADVVYSDRYFEHLIDLARPHPSIVQGGMTIHFSGADPLLSKYRKPDGVLSVPANVLGQIGWEHQVGEWQSWTMDGIEPATSNEMPNSHFIFWRSTNQVRIHCAHRSLVWASPAVCAAQSTALGGTIDSELPRYAGIPFYIPMAQDQMVYVALDDDRGVPTPRTSFAAFKQALVGDHGGRANASRAAEAHWQHFKTPCVVPALPVSGFPSEAEVELRFQRLMARLEEP